MSNEIVQSQSSFDLQRIEFQERQFELSQRIAKMFNQSNIVPAAFRGADKLPDCIVCVELASRLNLPYLAAFQHISVIQGKPYWSAALLISMVPNFGYLPLSYEEKGDVMKPGWGIRAYTYRAVNGQPVGEPIYSPWITYELIKAEGWDARNKKWVNLPQHMARLRSASWWFREHIGDLAGITHTQEEAEDIAPRPAVVDGGYAEEVKVSFTAPQTQEKPQPEQVTAASPKPQQTEEKAANQRPEDLFN